MLSMRRWSCHRFRGGVARIARCSGSGWTGKWWNGVSRRWLRLPHRAARYNDQGLRPWDLRAGANWRSAQRSRFLVAVPGLCGGNLQGEKTGRCGRGSLSSYVITWAPSKCCYFLSSNTPVRSSWCVSKAIATAARHYDPTCTSRSNADAQYRQGRIGSFCGTELGSHLHDQYLKYPACVSCSKLLRG